MKHTIQKKRHWVPIIKDKEKDMSKRNKKRSTRNEKTQDGKFHSKHIKHDPQAESARAVFDLDNDNTENKNESF